MTYRYVKSGKTHRVIDHANHAYEEWSQHLSSHAPAWTNGNDSGICCHECSIVIVERVS